MADLPVDASMRLEFKVDLKRVRHCERLTKAQEVQKEPHLRRSLILAYDIQELFRSSKATSLTQVGKWLNMTHSRISQLMTLLLLAPDIQEEIVFDTTGKVNGLTERHIRLIPVEADWQKQRELWQAVLAAKTPAPVPQPPSPELQRPI